MNDNYQAELIGILSRKPEYFSQTILTKEFFTTPYKEMFVVMKESYDKEKMVNLVALMSDPTIDKMLFANIVANVLHEYKAFFKSLESKALEEYRKKLIQDYNKELLQGDITVNDFTNKVDTLKRLSPSQISQYVGDDVRNVKTSKNNIISFYRYPKLNSLAKIREHDLVILAGKTGTGKTGFALNLLDDLSNKYNCLYINIELSKELIVNRLISMNTGITQTKLDYIDTLKQSEIDVINDYANKVDKNKNINWSHGSQSIESIREMVSSLDQDKHTIVIIDHIGRIDDRSSRSLYEKMTSIVIQLRNIALDNNCTIIGLCQLSRESKKADSPSLDLLRDSGEIEQSARKVLFLWEEKDKEYYLYVEKNDSGITGRIPIEYDKSTQKVEESTKTYRDIRR